MRYREILEASHLPLIKGEIARMRGSYGAFVITMRPMDFLHLTMAEGDYERISSKPFPYDAAAYTEIMDDMKNFGRYSIPFLTVQWPFGKIVGHEGRHRALMIHRAGGKNFPVMIFLRHPNTYKVTYEKYDINTEETTDESEDFGSDFEAAETRAEFLKQWNQDRRDAWGVRDMEPFLYHRVKIETNRRDVIKGSPEHINPDDPWDREAYKVDDMPKQLIGQYDDSVVVRDYKVGLVKGYKHFRS